MAVSLLPGCGHNDGLMVDRDGTLRITKTPIRSRSQCPQCGSPLFYIATLFTFLTGKRLRRCLAPRCDFVDSRRFKVTAR